MKYFLYLILMMLVTACQDKGASSREVSTLAAKDIYPIASYIVEQRRLVDSLQPAIVQFKTVNNKIDTALITTKEFSALVTDFLQPDITAATFDGKYEESSFADQTIPSVTLTYTALDKDLEIRRVDVLIEKGTAMGDRVRNIYVEKIINARGQSVSKKLFWRTNKYFQVITNIIPKGGKPNTEQVKVVWDPTE